MNGGEVDQEQFNAQSDEGMTIFPAIDLMDGYVVRLQQGDRKAVTIYSQDPVAMAKEWQSQGAKALHLVDLNGAFDGESKNLHLVKKMIEATGLPCQLGGGIRTMKHIEAAMAVGVSRVILGSAICESLGLLRQAVTLFGADKVAVGIDAKNGKVATHGWTQISNWTAVELAKTVINAGVNTVIYTDIATDGMLSGPNFAGIREMMRVVNKRVIASGGIASLEHVHRLSEIPGLYGCIIGTALYEKKFSLSQCLSTTR